MTEHGYWDCALADAGLNGDMFYCNYYGDVYSEYSDFCEGCEHWSDEANLRMAKEITNWEKYFGSPKIAQSLRVRAYWDRDMHDYAILLVHKDGDAKIRASEYLDWLNAEAQ